MWKPYFGQNLTFQSACVTLKIRSRSPKSTLNPFLTISMQVKIHPLVQTTVGGSTQPLPYNLSMQVKLKFTRWFRRQCREMADLYILYRRVTLKFRSRPPNLTNSFHPPNNVSASLDKIHPLIQKIMHGNEARWTPTG